VVKRICRILPGVLTPWCAGLLQEAADRDERMAIISPRGAETTSGTFGEDPRESAKRPENQRHAGRAHAMDRVGCLAPIAGILLIGAGMSITFMWLFFHAPAGTTSPSGPNPVVHSGE
jgi:hypothetical protein